MFWKIFYSISRFSASFIVFIGIMFILGDKDSVQAGTGVWDFCLFAFAIGAIILAMKKNFFDGSYDRNISLIGFGIIASPIIVLFGYGLDSIPFDIPWMYKSTTVFAAVTELVGFYLFCFSLISLLEVIAKNILSKK